MPEQKAAKAQTEEEKVVEMFQAYKQRGLAGIKEALHQRNEELRRERASEINPHQE
ncbi:MAG: hypothetical protein ABSE51_19765 [Terracidiphilus sp.]|jgi:hypothetical protein